MSISRAKLVWTLFGTVTVETLYSIPKLNYQLAAGTSGLAANVIAFLFCCAATFVAWKFRDSIAGSLERLVSGFGAVSPGWWLLTCGIVGGVVRVLWVIVYPVHLQSDYATYFRLAKALVETHSYGSTGSGLAYWPPGYPLFLASWFLLFGTGSWVLTLSNLCLFWATVVTVYRLTVRFSDSDSAKLAVSLLVFWPTYFTSAGLASKEMLVVLLLPASWLAYFASGDEDRRAKRLGYAFVSGLLLGYAALTQPSLLLFPAVFLAYNWLSRVNLWRSAAQLACLAFAMVVVIFPWTLRNYRVLGVWVPISTNGGDVFYRANNPMATGGYSPHGETNLDGLDEVNRNKVGYALGKRWILENPRKFVSLLPQKQLLFLGDDAQGVYESFKRGAKTGGTRYAVWKAISNMYWLALWTLILSGLFLSWKRGMPRVGEVGSLMLTILYSWSIHSVFESGAKYHLVLTAFISMLCILPMIRRREVQRA
jgi:4-amino-4-deoxy-L-arabinose transferase-like glycosyltransferase